MVPIIEQIIVLDTNGLKNTKGIKGVQNLYL